MPRLLSLALAFVLWLTIEGTPALVGSSEPIGLLALPLVAWLFAVRWTKPGVAPPREAGPLAGFLLPLILHFAWLGPFGGVLLWSELELPAIVGSWIGLVPFLAFTPFFRYAEGVLHGLERASARRFALQQTMGLALGILPLALVSQVWESGFALLPADEAAWTGGHRVLGFLVELGAPLLMLPVVLGILPRLLGAAGELERWREPVAAMWRGRGAPPRVLHWPTQGLFANAVAAGFGPWRCVLLSDRLQERLRDDEIQAVLAHEVAHLRRGHALSLLSGLLGFALAASVIVTALAPGSRDALWPALLALGVALVPFRSASRTFEMEADLDALAADPRHAGGLIGALTLLGGGRRRFAIRHLPSPERLAELELCQADPARAEAWRARARRWRFGMRASFPLGLAAAFYATL
ncbi:MAG TPA: M48 family metalloprotease [Planctomycetota bacterium]